MDKAVDPNGGFIVNILHSRAACAAGDSALHVLGFDEQETADLQAHLGGSRPGGPAHRAMAVVDRNTATGTAALAFM